MARNRNMYSRSKEARDVIKGMRGKYPWLKGNSPVMQLMQRKYAHPDEVTLAINSSYDGDIPDSIDEFGDFLTNQESPYNAFANDMWSMLSAHGPMTLENVEAYIPAEKLNSPELVDEIAQYVGSLMGKDTWPGEHEDSDIIYNNYAGDFDSDDFIDFEDSMQDLFDDARAYANASASIKEAEDSKESWLDKLYNKRNPIDSNGDAKGADGLAGTKDDRGTASKDNSGEPCDNCGGDGTIDEEDEGYASNSDTYADTDDSAADSGDDAANDDDDAQSNILNALLQHSL